jgi:hypothetical protein
VAVNKGKEKKSVRQVLQEKCFDRSSSADENVDLKVSVVKKAEKKLAQYNQC